MIALALPILFAAAALLAIAAIVQSWWEYGTAALALRSELKQCEASRSFDYRITSRDGTKPKAAQIITLPVRPSARRLLLEPVLRAAA